MPATLGVLVVALSATACGGGLVGLGASVAGAALPGARPQAGETRDVQLSAELREVDELQRRILVTTDDGRTGTVRYDASTLIVRGEAHVPLASLERGDRVVIHAREDEHGTLHGVRIDVQPASARAEADRAPAQAPAIERSGTISRIDHDAGSLVLATASGNITIWLPASASAELRERFRALREGDALRVETRAAAEGRLEISRFP